MKSCAKILAFPCKPFSGGTDSAGSVIDVRVGSSDPAVLDALAWDLQEQLDERQRQRRAQQDAD